MKKWLGKLHLSRQLWINVNTEIAFHTKENHPEWKVNASEKHKETQRLELHR